MSGIYIPGMEMPTGNWYLVINSHGDVERYNHFPSQNVIPLDIVHDAAIPTADVAPVVHGKWGIDAKFTDCIYARCNKCNTVQIFYYGKSFTKYCPECGAKMDA